MERSDLAPLDLSRVPDPSASPRSHQPPPVESSLDAGGQTDQRLPRLASESPASPHLGKRKAPESPLRDPASPVATADHACFGLASAPSSLSPFGRPAPPSPDRIVLLRPVILLPAARTTGGRGPGAVAPASTPTSAPPVVTNFASLADVQRPTPMDVEPFIEPDRPQPRLSAGTLAERRSSAAAKRRARPAPDDFTHASSLELEPCASLSFDGRPFKRIRAHDALEPTFESAVKVSDFQLDGSAQGMSSSSPVAASWPIRRSKSLPQLYHGAAPLLSPSAKARPQKSGRIRSTQSATRRAVSAIKGSPRAKGLAKRAAGPAASVSPGDGPKGAGVWTDGRSPPSRPVPDSSGEGPEGPYRTFSIPVRVPAPCAFPIIGSWDDARPGPTIPTVEMYVPPSGPSSSTTTISSPPPSVDSLPSRCPSSSSDDPPSESTSTAASSRTLPPSPASLRPPPPPPPTPATLRRTTRPSTYPSSAPPHVQVMTRHAVDIPRESAWTASSHTFAYPSPTTSIPGRTSPAPSSSSSSSSSSSQFGLSPVIHVPAWTPPITRASMNELELTEVLKNAQLRHDVVFDDGLRFRPNLDGVRGEKKRLLADRFWLAVDREIATGCRCTAFVHRQGYVHFDAPADAGLLPCVCEAGLPFRPNDPRMPACLPLSRLPSRVMGLVRELRSILLSLLPPSPPNGAGIEGIGILQKTPTRTHDLIERVLDPESIMRAIRRGGMHHHGLATFLGFILRSHCAPMRDWLVEKMIALVSLAEPKVVVRADPAQAINLEGVNGRTYVGLTGGLRLCFEVVELMKLDIANHQLRTLRPLLLETAIDFEVKQFSDGLVCTSGRRFGDADGLERTRRWFAAACRRTGVDLSSCPSEASSTEAAFRALCDGVLDLVFGPLARPSTKESLEVGSVPETLQMDLQRLQAFHRDLTDVTVAYMLLNLFSSLAGHSNLRPGDVSSVKSDVWVFLAEPALRGGGGKAGKGASGVKKLEDERWRLAMRDVVLHVAARAQATKARGRHGPEPVLPLPPPTESLVRSTTRWFDLHLRPQSDLFRISQDRLRRAVENIVRLQVRSPGSSAADDDGEEVQGSEKARGFPVTMKTGRTVPGFTTSTCPVVTRRSPSASTDPFQSWPFRLPAPSPGDGGLLTKGQVGRALAKVNLVDLSPELHHLGARIGKLLTFHLRAFHGLYHNLSAPLSVSASTSSSSSDTGSSFASS